MEAFIQRIKCFWGFHNWRNVVSTVEFNTLLCRDCDRTFPINPFD